MGQGGRGRKGWEGGEGSYYLLVKICICSLDIIKCDVALEIVWNGSDDVGVGTAYKCLTHQ